MNVAAAKVLSMIGLFDQEPYWIFSREVFRRPVPFPQGHDVSENEPTTFPFSTSLNAANIVPLVSIDWLDRKEYS